MTTVRERFSIDLPAMYADHHVVEVRRILAELPGVDDVYASSAFHVVEGCFDPAKTSLEAIRSHLDNAGYLDELLVPVETGAPATSGDGGPKFFRHTAVYEQTRAAVSFGQVVSYMGRPMWPCPGMGVIKRMEEE